jgi:hypothetical protein
MDCQLFPLNNIIDGFIFCYHASKKKIKHTQPTIQRLNKEALILFAIALHFCQGDAYPGNWLQLPVQQ